MTGHQPRSKKALSSVVAIGGSAGALEAFERIFKNLPDDVTSAFVVLQHMDPTQKTLLPELLQHAPLPVLPATDGLELEPRSRTC